jgi:hypothetical protein
MKNIEKIYINRSRHYSWLAENENRAIKFISKVRLLVFLLGLITTILLYNHGYIYLSISSFIVFLVLFIYTVKMHEKFKHNFDFTKKLADINNTSYERLKGNWTEFKDSGSEFENQDHDYSFDLDVFGKGSIFQWINTCKTELGRKKLADILKAKYHKRESILLNQQAIAELSHKIKFRQRLQCEAYFAGNNKNKYEIKDLVHLLNESGNKIYRNKFIIVLFKIIPVITISLLFMSFIFNMLPDYIGYLALLFPMLILSVDFKNRSNSLDTLFKLKENLSSYENIINMIYKERFSSKLIKQIQGIFGRNEMESDLNHGRFKPMEDLVKIVNNISERRNMAYLVLNILFLWDYQSMFALEKWKLQNGNNVSKWIEAIAEIEALSSLSIINFDHPNWCIPEILEKPLTIKAKSMAHPLIRGKAVSNDLTIGENSRVLLITGSNMSGKSTFLRTSGVNLILAYSGSAVCAEQFSCSIMNIHTCMRISDNLDKNISSFYGEILRIKSIVECANRGEYIFFLLDEIFKGTNSLDRHIGAKILINELRKLNTCGMVSTHDLELCDMEKESLGNIKNYHFREYYNNNKIYFDYKLKRGISETRNALYLMKMAGIDVPDDFKQKN